MKRDRVDDSSNGLKETLTSRSLRDRFGKHFDRYCLIRRAAGTRDATLQREYECHYLFWKYLRERRFKGDELAVKKQHVHEYANMLFEDPGTKHNTARRKIEKLRLFYREAVRQEWILKDPTADYRLPKKEENPITVLTVKQVKELLGLPDLTTAKGIRDRTMMELFYSSAFRLGEMAKLTDEDFTDDYRKVKIRGKGGKESILPVGRMAAHFAKFYVHHVWPRINPHGHDQLFLSVNTNQPMNKHVIYNTLRSYMKRIVPDRTIGMHVFRYSIATHLADEGVDIRLIQEFMRHDKPSTTARYIKRSFQRLQQVHRDTHPRK